jgi:hypothetical protein
MSRELIADTVRDAVREHDLSDDCSLEMLFAIYRLCEAVHTMCPDAQKPMSTVYECRRPDIARAMVDVLPALGMRAALSGPPNERPGHERVLEIAIANAMHTKMAGMQFCRFCRAYQPHAFGSLSRIGSSWRVSPDPERKRTFDQVYKN